MEPRRFISHSSGCLHVASCSVLVRGSCRDTLRSGRNHFYCHRSLGGARPVEQGFAVYRWGAANKTGGAKANETYAKWLGRAVVWAEDFEPNEQWENNIEGGGWQLGEWSAWKKAVPGRRLVLSIRSCPVDGTAKGQGRPEKGSGRVVGSSGNGDYTEHFKKLAENS